MNWEEKQNLAHILPIGEKSYALGLQSQRKACVQLLHTIITLTLQIRNCTVAL